MTKLFKSSQSNSFKPAWWLPNPHLQTLWATIPWQKLNLEIQWERLELPDGDFLDLAWVGRETVEHIEDIEDIENLEGVEHIKPIEQVETLTRVKAKKTPIVLILNGLTGNINSFYVRRIMSLVSQKNYRGVLMRYRGTQGVPNRLARSYHSGETGDLHYIVNELKIREPNTPIIVIGYSLGGNIVLKWLGETGKDNPVQAAASVSVPFEVGKCSDQLDSGFSKIYQWSLLRELCRAYQNKFKQSHLFPLYKDITKLKTLRDFDDTITAPLHGFKNAEDYYVQSSSRQYLSKIKVPSLIVHAQDDPFTPLHTIPKSTEVSPSVTYILTKQGGHLGFIAGKYPWKSEYWLDGILMKFIDSQLKNITM